MNKKGIKFPGMFKRFLTWKWLALLVILLIVGYLGWQSQQPPRNVPIAEIPTIKASAQKIRQTVQAEGQIVYADRREIFAPNQSKIVQIRTAGVGSYVRGGDILAMAEIENSFGRTEQLEIVTPIAGRVAEINIGLEDQIYASSKPAFVVMDTNQTRVKIDVNEIDLVLLKRNQNVEISIPALGEDINFSGRVVKIAEVPSSSAGVVTYPVEILINKPAAQLKYGMTADVAIIINEKESNLSLPTSYLVEKDGDNKTYVKVLRISNQEQNLYEIVDQEIQTGLIGDESAEITAGIDGNHLVVAPTFNQQRKFSLFGQQ